MKRALATASLLATAAIFVCAAAGCDNNNTPAAQKVTPRKPGADYDGPPIQAPKPPPMGSVDDPSRRAN
ncbi:MAG: hypothetical protein KF724_05615 [Phycisphaeraceae bacterium]|nr:hypothetical protein [Phycisphaeraceae bacterium]